MLKRMWLWIRRLIAKIFRREPPETIESVTLTILRNLVKLSKQGRINIYNGTMPSLRQAQADHTSIVYIVEITNPPSKTDLISFAKYVEKLRSLTGRGDQENH